MNTIEVEISHGKLRGLREEGVNIFRGIPYAGKVSRERRFRRSAMPNASPTDIFVAIASISMMGLGSVEIAEKKAFQNGAPVYLYNFGYKSEQKIPGTDYALGTPHAMDITFKFNNESLTKDRTEVLSGSRPERLTASHNMAELWTTFARTGRPAAAGSPAWRAYNFEDRPTMRIDTQCEVIFDRYSQELAMWRSIGRL